MPYLYIKVGTGYVGSAHEDWVELPDDWASMPDDEKASFKVNCEETMLSNHIEVNSWIVDDNGDVPEEADDGY